MPLGNSITQGDVNHATYRYHLWKMLGHDGYTVDFVGSMHSNFNGNNPAQDFDQDHEGHWGWRADQILNGISGQEGLAERLTRITPDIVLVHLGSNDIFQGEPVDQIISELKEIIMVLHSSNNRVVIFIAQILPVANTSLTERITRLNKAVEKLPSALGLSSQIRVVDQFDGFNPYTNTYDGVHPDRSGEIKMADKWHKSLKTVLEHGL